MPKPCDNEVVSGELCSHPPTMYGSAVSRSPVTRQQTIDSVYPVRPHVGGVEWEVSLV